MNTNHLPTEDDPPPASHKHTDVMVVGAGLAGLSAAEKLQQAGLHVTVLEARDRIGGRVWTLRCFDEQQHAEAGAEYISPEHTEMLSYTRRFGLPLIPWSASYASIQLLQHEISPWADHTRTSTLPTRTDPAFHPVAWLDALRRQVIDDPETPVESILGVLSAYSIQDALEAAQAPPAAWAWARIFFSAVEGPALDGLSAMLLHDQAPMSLNQKDLLLDQHYKIEGGNDQLPKAIAESLHQPVQLSCQVRSIHTHQRYPSPCVEVFADQDGQQRRWTADHVLLAVPVPALQQIHFQPALTAERKDALATLSSTPVCKMCIQFPHRFWQDDPIYRQDPAPHNLLLHDAPVEIWDSSRTQEGKAGLLTLYLAGTFAREIADIQDPEQRILRCLEPLFARWPDAKKLPRKVFFADWLHDPYTKGGWSYYPIDIHEERKLRPLLQSPEGPLWFAGTYLSDDPWQGNMEGALRSGIHAAQQLLQTR